MIRCENVGIQFEENWVFKNINLEVETGETVLLTGPSGCGKSLLLKVIAGLVKPNQGSINVKSKQIGMLFQRNALFDSLTALENLTFPIIEKFRHSKKEALRVATDWLNRVGLERCLRDLPNELSGGMQKRLGLARMWSLKPEVLLYDDPTAGLDPITSKRIIDLIEEQSKNPKGCAIVVTPDERPMKGFSHRILSMGKKEAWQFSALKNTEVNSESFFEN